MKLVSDLKDKVFMSYEGKRIWYRVVDGDICYMVARGDGTDEYFTTWQDAMEYIRNKKAAKRKK